MCSSRLFYVVSFFDDCLCARLRPRIFLACSIPSFSLFFSSAHFLFSPSDVFVDVFVATREEALIYAVHRFVKNRLEPKAVFGSSLEISVELLFIMRRI